MRGLFSVNFLIALYLRSCQARFSSNSPLESTVPVTLDDIRGRILPLCADLNKEYVDIEAVSTRILKGLFSGITANELDSLAAETAAYMSTDHPDYAKLAARIAVSNLHNSTIPSFSGTIELLYRHVDPKTGSNAAFISEKVYTKVMKHAAIIDAYIKTDRDFGYDYFGFKTLEKSYLFKIDEKVVERPQYMLMRVALGIHIEDDEDDLSATFETYDLMSQKWFTHASPTLFNSGTPTAQFSSCFLLGVSTDSIDGIYSTLKQCALISKSAGGIGLSVQNVRAKGSYIKGTKGISNGLVPMLRVFDTTARYVDQGGGKRPGAFAVYLEPWHADIFEVLDLRKNTGKEESRARDLFYGLWIPDLFMKRVEEDGDWALMCPMECPGLDDCWGDKFESLYTQYESQGKYKRAIKARELWYAILDAQMETGTPYMLYKDACNSKSNQQNLGTIKCSNLCTEVVQFSSPEEVAVCNLASIVLSRFLCSPETVPDSTTAAAATAPLSGMPPFSGVYKHSPLSPSSPNEGEGGNTGTDDPHTNDDETAINGSAADSVDNAGFVFDHLKLYEITKVVTRNLNKIIDGNNYPVAEARRSNLRHRPIGIGVQGLADLFQMMRLPFDCPAARRLNKEVFETIYFAALDASCELAEKNGAYETFPGSPASFGKLQFDMWGVTPSARWNWAALKSRIARHGLRNSLLVAPMPTASTAQILGNNECFEPYTSNMYVRRVRAGEFIIVNSHLLKELVTRNLWTKEIRNQIMSDGGSVQNIPEIPAEIKDIYRTVWEIKQRSLIDMAADRGAFVDQSQSLNVFMPEPNYSKLTSMHFYSWRKGLKTGMYYLRTKPAAKAIQFTVDNTAGTSSNASASAVSSSLGATPAANDGDGEGGVGNDGGGDNRSSTDSTEKGKVYGEACTSCSA